MASKLFSPVKIRAIHLKNRIVVSPMCQYSSVDGYANDWHFVHLGSRAVGGAGIVFTEATAVSPEGRISPDDLGIYHDEHIPELKRITDFIKAQNSIPAIQLAHAGRKASTHSPWKGGKHLSKEEGAWETFAPSAIPYREHDQVPTAMDQNAIDKVISDFENAAIRALKAGFQIIEIHAAHGYLFHEFLSPLSNTRLDNHGGSFENRSRLLIQVVKAVRKLWPEELPLFVRLSCTDYTEGGWTLDDSVMLAGILKENGVDLIDCSSGANVSGVRIPVFPGYQVDFAEEIKSRAGIMTGAVGLITTAEQAENILSENKSDLILMARELLRDPYFPLRAGSILNEDLSWPAQYERGKPMEIRK